MKLKSYYDRAHIEAFVVTYSFRCVSQSQNHFVILFFVSE